MDLFYLITAVLRKKWIIIICALIGAGAGYFFSTTRPKLYASIAQYSTGFTQTQKITLRGDESFNFYEVDTRFSNVIESFRSPTVLGMLAYDLLLHDLESSRPFTQLTAKQKKDTSYTTLNMSRVKDILHQKIKDQQLLSNDDPEEKKIQEVLKLYGYDEATMKDKILVERVLRTDFLDVSCATQNPELSAHTVNTIGKQFTRFYTSLNSVRTQESIGKLDSLYQAKKREVDDLRKKLQDVSVNTGTSTNGNSDRATTASNVAQEFTSKYSDELVKLNGLRFQKQSVDEQLAALSPAPATNTSTPATNNNAEILSLRRQNQDLNEQLAQKGGNDPDIQNKIDANNRRISTLTASNPVSGGGSGNRAKDAERREALLIKKTDIETDIKAAEENVKLFDARVKEYQKIANTGGDKMVLANNIKNDLTVAEKDLDKYNNSLFASQDVDVAPDINIKQTMLGQPPTEAMPTHRMLVTAIAAIALVVISSLLIIILEFLDTSLKTPSFFHKTTKLKLLAVINRVDLKRKSMITYFDVNAEGDRENNKNIFIENLRKLRYELENSGKKIILFTSTKPQEGKTTVIEALANGFSLSKKKVLMVDMNFSNNTITQRFEAKAALEQFSLNGQPDIMEDLKEIISASPISNVDIIGCTEGNYTPSEILPKNNLLDNIHAVAQRYDYILLEAASLNHHADSKEISKYIDGIVAVFSAKSVIRETDKESIQFLKNTGNKFIGCVLNNVQDENIDL